MICACYLLRAGDQGACRLPPSTTGLEVPLIPTQTDRVTGTCRQTAPNSDRHRSVIPNINRWGHGNSCELTPQPPGCRVTGGCYDYGVGAQSPQPDPEGGGEGHSGELG